MFRKLVSVVGEHHNIGRYSLEKLHLFEHYQRSTSPQRVAAVLILTPLPTFFALVAMNLGPLNDPRAGPNHNVAFFIRSAVSQALRTFFTLLPMKQALALSSRDYSFKKIACVACCTALVIETVTILLAFTWRFPVAHSQMFGIPLFLVSICGFSFVFAHATMRRLWRKRKLQLYVPIISVQLVLFYSFLGLSVAFAHLPLTPQIFLVVLFPLVKFVLKHLVWKYAKRLNDISTDITICMLEISGALYQTVCVQFVNSNWLNVLMVVADLLQCVHEVRTYMTLDFLGDGRNTLHTALTIIESALGEVENQSRHSSFSSPGTHSPLGKEISPTAIPVDGGGILDIASLSSIRSSTLWPHRSAPSSDAGTTQSLDDRGDQLHIARSVYIPNSTLRMVQLTRGKNTRRLMELNLAASLRESEGRVARHDDKDISHNATESGVLHKRHPHRSPSGAVGNHAFTTTAALARSPHDQLKSVELVSRGSGVLRHWGTQRNHRTAKIYAIADAKLTGSQDTPTPTALRSLEAAESPSPVVLVGNANSTPPRLRHSSSRRKSTSGFRIDGVRIAHRHQARILEQTLQLLFASEVLLFAEYMEVVIPVLYALCLTNEWLSPNAKYNVVVMNMTTQRVVNEVWSSLGYALLELVTLLAMYWFMRRRYGVSALYQLAFVLETYWMTLQGKLVGTFIVVFNVVTVHEGATMILSA